MVMVKETRITGSQDDDRSRDVYVA